LKKKVEPKIAIGNLLLSSPLFRLAAPKHPLFFNPPIATDKMNRTEMSRLCDENRKLEKRMTNKIIKHRVDMAVLKRETKFQENFCSCRLSTIGNELI
jgi:hypothetical protein